MKAKKRPKAVDPIPQGYHLHVYVKDAEKQFYGDRLGTVEDPFGHVWHLATHVEDVSPKEMQKRAAELAAKAKP